MGFLDFFKSKDKDKKEESLWDKVYDERKTLWEKV